MEGERIGIGLKSNPPNYFVERLLNGDGRQQLRSCQKSPLTVSNAFLHLPWTTSMFDPKHESKPLKVHNSRDVIACSNSNLMIRYFHRYRHALLGLPRIGGGRDHHRLHQNTTLPAET